MREGRADFYYPCRGAVFKMSSVCWWRVCWFVDSNFHQILSARYYPQQDSEPKRKNILHFSSLCKIKISRATSSDDFARRYPVVTTIDEPSPR